MAKGVALIKAKQYRQARMLINLKSSLFALAVAAKNGLSEIRDELKSTNGRIDKLTDAVSYNMGRIFDLGKNDQMIAYSTTAQVNQLLILNALNDLTRLTENLLDNLIESFHELQMGRLPQKLIGMNQLNQLLLELTEELKVSKPNYELASTLSSDYYRSESIIWGIADNNIVINLPVIIVERNSKPFELFEIQTFHVPTDVQTQNEAKYTEPSSYTKINMEHKYIAIDRDVYILLSDSNLRDCTELQGILYCKDLVIHTHRNAPSCPSTLYWQDDIELIDQYCQVHYYHNIVPTPMVFEDANSIMLTNVASDWRISCDSNSFPHPVTGMTYAIIDKKALCECQMIIGQSHFIPRTQTGCVKDNMN
jgi:hypothetical protein